MSLKDAVGQFMPGARGGLAGNMEVLAEGIHAEIVADFQAAGHSRRSRS